MRGSETVQSFVERCPFFWRAFGSRLQIAKKMANRVPASRSTGSLPSESFVILLGDEGQNMKILSFFFLPLTPLKGLVQCYVLLFRLVIHRMNSVNLTRSMTHLEEHSRFNGWLVNG